MGHYERTFVLFFVGGRLKRNRFNTKLAIEGSFFAPTLALRSTTLQKGPDWIEIQRLNIFFFFPSCPLTVIEMPMAFFLTQSKLLDGRGGRTLRAGPKFDSHYNALWRGRAIKCEFSRGRSVERFFF